MSIKRVLIELSRVVVGGLFVLSGLLKAIDPVGTSLKIGDYITSIFGPDWSWLSDISVWTSIGLCVLEFTLGAFLLMGIYRRIVSTCSFGLMVLMTLITIFIYVTDAVADCGCFGDAIKISNGASLTKNLVLLFLSYILMSYSRAMGHLFSLRERWLPAFFAIGGITYFTYQNYYNLPFIDFRPYRIGYNLKEKIYQEDSIYQEELIDGTKYVYQRDGQEQTFSVNSLPDTTWTYLRQEQSLDLQQYKPTYFFELRDEHGNSRENEILQDTVGTILLLSTNWVEADQRSLSEINELNRYALERGYKFYGISSSTPEEEAEWRYQTGAEYPIFFADATIIKTIARANPALMILKNGIIKDKIALSMLPSREGIEEYVESRMHKGISSLPSNNRLIPLLVWGVILALALLRVLVRRVNIVGYKFRQSRITK